MTIDPTAFSIGSINIQWYGILVTAGIFMGVLTAYRSAVKYGWTGDDIIDVALVAIPLAIVGARLYYVAFFWDYYAANPIEIVKTWHGGLAIWGGIIGGVLGGVVYCWWKKRDLITLLDLAMPSIAIGQAIGRWGNFVNQEAYGRVIANPNWQWFPFAVFIQADGQYHYAAFFYESMWCLLLFVFLLNYRKHFRHRGDVACSYLMLYSLERVFVEELRTDSLMWGSFRVSQVLSAVVFLGIAAFFIIRRLRESKSGVMITNPLHKDYVSPVKEGENSEEAAPPEQGADSAGSAGDAEKGTDMQEESPGQKTGKDHKDEIISPVEGEDNTEKSTEDQ